MKKFLVLTLVMALVLSVIPFNASALSFTDLDESHWAYTNVQTLVSDGTVSGYEDGSFRPGGSVTRAEFVKMLGMGSVTRVAAYSDVATTHWAYSYVMNSSFPEDGTNLFQPDIPITRGLVAELLWNRGGNPEPSVFVPSLITSQYARSPKAVAWVYTTGLIRGDGDGINLRLSDSLSRAEAATLIVRARSAVQGSESFNDIVNDDIVLNVYNALNLFDGKAYDASATITNGEMARAALRIGNEQTNLSYYGQTVPAAFEHPYGRDISIVWSQLKKGTPTVKDADAAANFGDTIAALSYQFIYKSHDGQEYGNVTDSLKANYSDMMNICLTFAKDQGIISLNENLEAPVTMRDFTTLCLLFDQLVGSQTTYCTQTNSAGANIKSDSKLLMIPESYGIYRAMIADAPIALYTTPFVNSDKNPADSYNFAREFSSTFISILQYAKNAIKANTGAKVDFTYYPSLVCENGNGYTLRVACDIISMDAPKTVKELFNTKEGIENADLTVTQNTRIYFDLATGEAIKSISMTGEKAYIEQILYAELAN